MSKFSLKDLLMLIAVVALVVAYGMTTSELSETLKQLTALRNEMRYLSIEDEHAINAISIPGLGRRSWRWRLHLPEDRKFRLRLAFDDIPIDGLPEIAPDNMRCELPTGESILSAALVNENGEWGVHIYSETQGASNFDFIWDVTGRDAAWLEKRGGVSTRLAGSAGTRDGPADEPYVLLSLRNALSPQPGVTQTNPNPTDGVLIWIQESE